jgi:hypothetical protein
MVNKNPAGAKADGVPLYEGDGEAGDGNGTVRMSL